MKTFQSTWLFLLLTLHSFNISQAQSPSWKWAQSASGEEYDQSSTVTTDPDGNVIVAGYYKSDSLLIGNVTLYNSGIGFDEIFIAKYDSGGNFIWAQSFGNENDDKATAVRCDANGNIYLAGYFSSDTLHFGNISLVNAGTVGDIFIVKFDAAGNVIRAQREGGPSLEIPYALTLDANENILVTGRFSSSSITFGTTTLTQSGSMDIFLVKYDTSGSVLWAKKAGGGSNDEAYTIATDPAGNIYIAGYFNQTATFGTFTVTTSGLADMFLAKYDQTGTEQWVKRAGGSGDDRITSLAVNTNSDIYLCAYSYSSTLSIGSLSFSNNFTNGAFLAKYSGAGNLVWAHNLYGKSLAHGISVSGNHVYLAASFNSDSLLYGSSILLLEGNLDFCVAHCDTSGNTRYAVQQSAGGSSNERANAIHCDALGNVIIAGLFDSDPLTFGPDVLINNSNGFDMFIAKMGGVATGLHALKIDTPIWLQPNPAKERITLTSPHVIEEIEIQNILGEIVYTYKGVDYSKVMTIDISSLKAGVYLLKTKTRDQVQAGKFVVN